MYYSEPARSSNLLYLLISSVISTDQYLTGNRRCFHCCYFDIEEYCLAAAVDGVGECTGQCCKPQHPRLTAGPSSPDSVLPYAYPGLQSSPYPLHSLPPQILAQLHSGGWMYPGMPNGSVRVSYCFVSSLVTRVPGGCSHPGQRLSRGPGATRGTP